MQDTEINFQRTTGPLSFGHVNVFLGSNGTGKSKILNEFKGYCPQAFAGRQVVYVEGGRTIKLTSTLKLTKNNFNQYSTLETAKSTHTGKKQNTLSDRVNDALLLLDKMGQEIKDAHSDAVEEWKRQGQQGNVPSRDHPPIERLFDLFTELFPSISLELDSNNKNILCSKNGSATYTPSELSDGEKQVLSILADIAILAEPNSIIIVDEPELNLNFGLACQVWDAIERELPEAVFVYATHNVSFAMRRNIDHIYVLSSDNSNICEISDLDDVPPEELRKLLGTIPAILASSHALIVEGEENSFDGAFYRWLIGTHDVSIVPAGSSSDVTAIVTRSNVWNRLATSMKLLGVIDRDFKPDETLSENASSNCHILKYHEAESYLCHPELVVAVSEALGLCDQTPTIEDVKSEIVAEFQTEMLMIVARRIFERATLSLSVSIPKAQLSTIGEYEALESTLVALATEQIEFAESGLGPEVIKPLLKSEHDACAQILRDQNVEAMLALTPGKSLLARIYKLTGAKDYMAYVRACSKHINIESFRDLMELKNSLSGFHAVGSQAEMTEAGGA